MSNQENNPLYPLQVIYKDNSVSPQSASRGILVEYDPESDRELPDNYSVSSGTVFVDLKHLTLRREIKYELDYADEALEDKKQIVNEEEWISAVGEAENASFSFFGSQRTTGKLEVIVKIATLASIDECLDILQMRGDLKNQNKRHALRDRLTGKGYFIFDAFKDTGDEIYREYGELFSLSCYLLPTHFETIKNACVRGKPITAFIDFLAVPRVFSSIYFDKKAYKILDSIGDVSNKSESRFDDWIIDYINGPQIGFEFSFLVKEHDERKNGVDDNIETAESIEPQSSEQNDSVSADQIEHWRSSNSEGELQSHSVPENVDVVRRSKFYKPIAFIIALLRFFR